jgi:serine/threonine-protein kinase PknK
MTMPQQPSSGVGAPFVPGVAELSQVGRGGFATVFRGYQERFDRWVAVKVLDVDRLDSASLRRFERECAAMGRLSNHVFVVTIYDSGILDEGRPYLLSEYCDGGSLEEQLARFGHLPMDQVLNIGYKIASALHDAHRMGIIHRDVKPANILIRSSGEPGLADFGLSLRTDSTASRGLDAFSPDHAAPESPWLGEGPAPKRPA